MGSVTIKGYEAKAGEHVFYRMPVSKLASGLELELPLHILNGKEEGPVLMLTALSLMERPQALK